MNDEMIIIDEIKEKKKFRRKINTSIVMVVLISLLTAIFISISRVNHSVASITRQFNNAMARGNYAYAMQLFDYGIDTVNYYNNVIHFKIFSMGNSTIHSYMEAVSRVDGMDAVYEVFRKYYPDKYPKEIAHVYNNCIAYKEARKICDSIAENVTDYQAAVKELDKIAAENPDYPKYVFLNCKLTCARKCGTSIENRLRILKDLENNYFFNTWLYAYEGALVYLDNHKYGEALKMCDNINGVKQTVLRMKIYRLMGDYDEAIKLYDESYDENNPNELLDNEKMKNVIIDRGGNSVFEEFSQYSENLDNCSETTLYLFQIAALEANNGKKYSEITSYMNKKNIPQSAEILDWDMETKDVSILLAETDGDFS